MSELTCEQSEKADYLLQIICNSDSALGSNVAYDLFDSREDAIYVCSILKKLNLINIITETENDPFYLFGFNENTCNFLKQGGFSAEHKIMESNNNPNLNKDTIQVLVDMMNGKSFTMTKDRPDEIVDLIVRLNNLGFINKVDRFRYTADLTKRKQLTKLIELKSWTDFLNWSDSPKTDRQIVNDFSGSTIGQINQSDFLEVGNTKINQTNESVSLGKRKNSLYSFFSKFWWQILIPLIIGIILIMLEKGIISIGI